MKITWYMWVGLALILAPIVQQWVSINYPSASYPIAGLVVLVIGGVAKWLELVLADRKVKKDWQNLPDGAAAAPMPAQPSKLRRMVWG